MALSPHGQHGDRLWVRETWRTYESLDHRRPASIGPGAGIQYEAGGTSIPGHGPTLHGMGKLRPSTHMPRWACRLVLEIVDVRVERLQDITEEDVRPEGLSCWATEWVDDKGGDVIKHWGTAAMENRSDTARDAFGKVWSSIYGAESWAANPYVWAISFKRVGAEP